MTQLLRLVILVSTLAMGVGCDSQTVDNRSSKAKSTVGTPSVGLNTGSQVLTQKDASNQRVAQVQLPVGSLAVDQQITVQGGFHTDVADVAKEFGFGNDTEIKPSGVATVISSNIDANLNKPMTIALDLPVSGTSLLSLFHDHRHFFIVFTVRDAVAKTWKRGIVPEASVTQRDNKLFFTSKLVGKFEVFQSSKAVEAPAEERIISKPDLVSAPVAITGVNPLVAQNEETVTLTGKYFSANTKVMIGGFAVGKVNVKDSNTLTFGMPDIFGLKTITVADAGNEAKAEIVGRSIKIDKPISSFSPDKVCKGIEYYNYAGDTMTGTLECDYQKCTQSGMAGCITTADVPSLSKNDIQPKQMLINTKLLGVAGTYNPDDHMPSKCTDNAQAGCLTDTTFLSINKAELKPAIIKKGHTIRGFEVKGLYPSSQHKLPDANLSTSDLTTSNFNSSMSSNATFEFWDANGTRHTASGSANLKADNVVNGVRIFSVTGNHQATVNIDPMNLRHGVSVGGTVGKLKTDCRNLSKIATFDGDNPGTSGKADFFDTISDGLLPKGNPWTNNAHTCDETNWKEVTNRSGQPATCTEVAEDCVWQDLTTKKLWAGQKNDNGINWTNAANHCKNLSVNGKSNWRLPTQKELMTAYVNGIAAIAGENAKVKGKYRHFWTASASMQKIPHTTVDSGQIKTNWNDPNPQDSKYVVDIHFGAVFQYSRYANKGYICVHD